MPHNYWGEAKEKFRLPSYPKENAFDDSTKYEAAVNLFGMDCQWVLAEHSTWVNHDTITNLVHESEAACARAAEDNKHCKGEEEKRCWEPAERPRKQRQVETVGPTVAES